MLETNEADMKEEAYDFSRLELEQKSSQAANSGVRGSCPTSSSGYVPSTLQYCERRHLVIEIYSTQFLLMRKGVDST